MNIVFVYSCDITSPQSGTPIRIASILAELQCQPDLTVTPYATMGKTLWQRVREIGSLKADIVFGNTYQDFPTLLLVKLLYGKRIAIDLHGAREEELFLNGTISATKKAWLAFWYARLMPCFDLVTVVCRKLQQRFAHVSPLPTIVYPGFDPETHPPIEAPRSVPVLGYIGSARSYQGVDAVLEVGRLFADRGHSFILRLVSADRERMEKLLSTTFPTRPSWVETCYDLSHDAARHEREQCDILLILRPANPVTELSFPAKVSECLASGKTMIISSFSDIPQLFTSGQHAFVVDAEKRVEQTVDFLERIFNGSQPPLDPAFIRSYAAHNWTTHAVCKPLLQALRNLKTNP